MSFAANTGLVYIPMLDWGPQALAIDEKFVYDARQGLNIGTKGGSCASEPSSASPPTPPAIGPMRTAPEGTGEASWLIAWDPVLQKERWRAFGHGGTMATAGNLVFQVGNVPRANTGSLRAYNASTGEKLLEVAIPSTTAEYMSPPVTFMLDGRQYVVLASYITPRRPVGSLFGQARPPEGPRIYAFVLDGIGPTP